MISYQLVAGDTLSYLLDPPTGAGGAYSPADGWALKYRLIPRSGAAAVIEIDAQTSGSSFQIAVPASITVAWEAGLYSAVAWVEKGVEKYTVAPAFTQVEILPDPRTAAAGLDGRTLAQRTIDDLLAAFATYSATNGTVMQYQINGRLMMFKTAKDIEAQLAFWRRERAKEVRRDAVARGMADPRFTYVRFDGHGS